MSIVPVTEVVSLLSSISLDGNGVGMLACLIGIAGGWYITSYRDQMKAKKAKIEERKNERPRRD